MRLNIKSAVTESLTKPHTSDGASSTESTEGQEHDVSSASAYRQVLLETLDRIGCGGVVLDSKLNVLAANAVAVEISKACCDAATNDPAHEIATSIQRFLKSTSLPAAGNDWVTTWCNAEHPIAILRICNSDEIVLLLVDIGTRLRPSTRALRHMFGLTSAESKLALGLASGSSPDELAREIGVRKTTVRTQLASVFAKTNTCRQGELVALLARVAILP